MEDDVVGFETLDRNRRDKREEETSDTGIHTKFKRNVRLVSFFGMGVLLGMIAVVIIITLRESMFFKDSTARNVKSVIPSLITRPEDPLKREVGSKIRGKESTIRRNTPSTSRGSNDRSGRNPSSSQLKESSILKLNLEPPQSFWELQEKIRTSQGELWPM